MSRDKIMRDILKNNLKIKLILLLKSIKENMILIGHIFSSPFLKNIKISGYFKMESLPNLLIQVTDF